MEVVKCREKHFSEAEQDMLNDLISGVVLSAEQAGFENGVKFAIKFLCSVLAD